MANMTESVLAQSDPSNASRSAIQSSSNALRYAAFDGDAFSLYSSGSPSRAKRTLEAHLKDTDRRIQDASRLGTTLLQQRKELTARLKEVEEVESDTEVPEDLRKKLTELEKEYNEVGKESARAFLPKAQASDSIERPVLSASGRESPTKLTAPSRKQRNVPTNRVHDIEFATEISTSLLAQVRQLQAALVEKDDALKGSNSTQAELQTEVYNLAQRLKRLDENEQRFKDENWALETKLQELEASIKASADQETRLNAGLRTAQSEKAMAQREFDTLKAAHEKMNEDLAQSKKQQETDLHNLRKDISTYQLENQSLHKKMQEMTSQNSELAKAVSYRTSQPSAASDREFVTADEDADDNDLTHDHFDPTSPIKGTPRHGVLESETLKSSLNHAHRMIQNLKSNIHREKTEKIELKRMLQDARDEIENRRGDTVSTGAGLAKKRRNEVEGLKFKKPTRPDRLGATRGGTTEILDADPEWEDHNGERTPSRSVFPAASVTRPHDPESTDAFETANERNTTTETESFETGNEGLAGDDSDDLTETEGSVHRANIARRNDRASLARTRSSERYSYLSTASTSDEETQDELRTPSSNDTPKFRSRISRMVRGQQKFGDVAAESPGSLSVGTPASNGGTPRRISRSLGDELDGLDDESLAGTPISRTSAFLAATPDTLRNVDLTPRTPSRTPVRRSASPVPSQPKIAAVDQNPLHDKPEMSDAGVMTDPWKPEDAAADHEKPSLVARAGGIVGAIPAVLGLGQLGQSTPVSNAIDTSADERSARGPKSTEDGSPDANHIADPVWSRSAIIFQSTEPIEPIVTKADLETDTIPVSTSGLATSNQRSVNTKYADVEPVILTHTRIVSQETTPIEMVHNTEDDALQHHAEPTSYFSGSPPPEPDLSFSSIESQDYSPSPEPPLRSEKRNAVIFEDAKPAMVNYANGLVFIQDSPVLGSAHHAQQRAESMKDGAREAASAPPAIPARAPSHGDVVLRESSRDSNAVAGLNLVMPAESERPGSVRGSSHVRDQPQPSASTTKPAVGIAITSSTAQAASNANNSMGPPLMPASAYKNVRPKTPVDRASRDVQTSRGAKTRDGRVFPSPSNVSRRTSMSSFVSEIDDRFNGRRAQPVYPAELEPSTDPRMIQAITQTMIGEYLWKYTRKAGRSETSSTRHRRFFWVHPYTRTLYWSEQDPSTAGRSMLKAKSVAIDAVRVVSDDNTYPPGLHRKSIVVVTPGREIVFTAPTGQRHETWYNALSYLLLRTEQEKAEMDNDSTAHGDAEPQAGGFSFRRSLSRVAGRDASQSRQSLSSYNSRTTRASSATRIAGNGSSIAGQRMTALPQTAAASSPQTRASVSRESDVAAEVPTGRFSSITGKFTRTAGASTRRGRSSISKDQNQHIEDPADIYDASVVNDSAEDLRAVIARQDEDADRLENVRACCDGKHDVGSLTHRSGRSSGPGHRITSGHQHQAAANDSVRSRA